MTREQATVESEDERKKNKSKRTGPYVQVDKFIINRNSNWVVLLDLSSLPIGSSDLALPE